MTRLTEINESKNYLYDLLSVSTSIWIRHGFAEEKALWSD